MRACVCVGVCALRVCEGWVRRGRKRGSALKSECGYIFKSLLGLITPHGSVSLLSSNYRVTVHRRILADSISDLS